MNVLFMYSNPKWTILGSLLWSSWLALREGWSNLLRLHQIPCSHCAFFTGEYRLKCTVHPFKALSEEAIDCLDYESTSLSASIYLSVSDRRTSLCLKS